MKKKFVFLILLVLILLSCSFRKAIKEVFLIVSPIKEDIEKPDVKQGTVHPERPPGETREERVIPPEQEIRKPGEKEVTVFPGRPGVKKDGVPQITSPGLVIGKPGEEMIITEETIEDIQRREEFRMPTEEMISHLFGEPVKEKIAMLPFENLSEIKDAPEKIMPVLNKVLREKSIGTVEEKDLYELICKERVRNTGNISKDLAQKIHKEFEVKSIFLGSIVSYINSINPQFGLLGRLIDATDGSIIWANYASATGDEYAGVLGLGDVHNITDMFPRISEELLKSFDTSIPYRDIESTYKIAIMPFLNKSRYKDADMIVLYMFLVELSKSPMFQVLEYGEVRKAIIKERISYKGELDYEAISKISGLLDVDGIVLGTVEQYSSGLKTSSPPEVTISVRLLNARKKKIIWYNSLQINGDEGIFLFDFGKIRSVDKVAYKIVSILAKDMERSKWR